MNQHPPFTPVPITADPSSIPAARDLARRLNLPYRPTGSPAIAPATPTLRVSKAGRILEGTGFKPFRLDFTQGPVARRVHATGRRDPLARAIGLRPGRRRPRVLDATAGLGRDALILAGLGADVELRERHPVLWALLEDALVRARSADSPVAEATTRTRLLPWGDTRIETWPQEAHDGAPRIIYLDPMHTPRGGAALVKKEMRIVRDLVGDDLDQAELLAWALAQPVHRVVVKRAAGNPAISAYPPDQAIPAGTVRFDIYRPLR